MKSAGFIKTNKKLTYSLFVFLRFYFLLKYKKIT